MPRPLQKRKAPKPAQITIRYVGGQKPTEIVDAPALRRRDEELSWLRVTVSETISWDLWDNQTLLALRRNDTITVPDYTGEVWWFVLDVDGPAKAITADTLLFDQPFERSFPFRMVLQRDMETWEENVEAAVALDRLTQLRGNARTQQQPPPPLAHAA